MIRLLIAEDHAIVRAGLKQLFSTETDLRVAGEAENGGQVLEALRQHEYDLLLLDLNMPGLSGVDMVARVYAQYPKLPVLVLSMHNTVQVAMKALKAGAKGYITKDSDPDVLLAAIRKVARGGKFMSPELAEKMLFEEAPVDTDSGVVKLSNRELDVLQRLVKGVSINDIADQLNISNKTVSTHKARLMEKLQAHSTADLIIYAMQHGMMS